MVKNKTKNVFKLEELEVEVTNEPFVVELDDETSITFADPQALGWEDAENLVSLATNESVTPTEVLSAWLSEEDFEALRGANLSLQQIVKIMEALGEYYAAFFGADPKN